MPGVDGRPGLEGFPGPQVGASALPFQKPTHSRQGTFHHCRATHSRSIPSSCSSPPLVPLAAPVLWDPVHNVLDVPTLIVTLSPSTCHIAHFHHLHPEVELKDFAKLQA